MNRYNLVKKGFVIILFQLFIGLIVLPSFNGSITSQRENREFFFSSQPSLSNPNGYVTNSETVEHTKTPTEKNHTMQVNVTPTTGYAGDNILYDILISLVDGGHPDKDGLHVRLYNETGTLVIGDDALDIAADYTISDYEHILSGGTYHLYAYNDTHDSQGHNATIVILKYTVLSSPPILVWKIDTSVNMTFHLIPPGNGTLELQNVTYSLNASYPGHSTYIAIENGIGTLNGVNATTQGNITFNYEPDGGSFRPADGVIHIVPPILCFFSGLISDVNDSSVHIIYFKATFVYFAMLNPFEIGRVIPYEEIWISSDYRGYIGPRFIFGFFKIAWTEYP